jgi:hypothetical protein
MCAKLEICSHTRYRIFSYFGQLSTTKLGADANDDDNIIVERLLVAIIDLALSTCDDKDDACPLSLKDLIIQFDLVDELTDETDFKDFKSAASDVLVCLHEKLAVSSAFDYLWGYFSLASALFPRYFFDGKCLKNKLYQRRFDLDAFYRCVKILDAVVLDEKYCAWTGQGNASIAFYLFCLKKGK